MSGRWGPVILAGLAGAAFFIAIYGVRPLDPRQVQWLMRGDWQTHFLGWHLFRAEPWTLPPGAIRSLAAPIGTSVGYTDSLPLVAFLFKPFHAVLPADFQYIGLWLLACFALQGVFGALLVATVTRSSVAQVSGGILFVLSPILLFRTGHPALAAHWLILAALWLYLSSESGGRTGLRPAGWAVLAAIAATTHPYLTVMVLGLAGAFALRQMAAGRTSVAQGVSGLVALAAGVLVLWWLSGYFVVRTTDMPSGGIGAFSMNVLAPVMTMGRSAFLPELPLLPGQYEGFNYLGLGVLALAGLAAALLVRRPPEWRGLVALLPLFAVVAAFTVFALSNVVTVGERVVADVGGSVWRALGMFRATGRFGWPAHYLLLALAITVVARRLPAGIASACLVGAVAVQLADASPVHRRIVAERNEFGWYTWGNPLFSRFWTAVPPHYRRIALLPSTVCGVREAAAAYEPFAYLAGHLGLEINSAAPARFDGAAGVRYCDAMWTEIRSGTADNDTLYIVRPELAAGFFDRGPRPVACVRVDAYTVCFTLEGSRGWRPAFEFGEAAAPPAGALSIEELATLHDRLEATYRDDLRRAPVDTFVGRDLAAAALRLYLAFRAQGCGHRGAANRTLIHVEGIAVPPCAQDPEGGTVPPRNETRALLEELEEAQRARGAPRRAFVDLEGRAVWTQEYARLRGAGCGPDAAGDAVIAAIVSGAGTPVCR